MIFIRFVFDRIQALKIPFNYHFKACSTAYQAVLSNIFQLIPVIFKSAPKLHQNIVQMSKSLMMLIRIVFGRIQALKIPFNYHFKACSTSYQSLPSRHFSVISVIFESTSKVGQIFVEKNVKMKKSMMMFIRFVFS